MPHRDAAINDRALQYDAEPRAGKTGVQVTKPAAIQRDLSLASTPGVAKPVRRIHANPDASYRYINKGNRVAVITDGSAVLGLGNVGSLAGTSVMEGKAVLFKHFADFDCFDIEVQARRPQGFIETVMRIAPTVGGINLQDIAAPHCFESAQALIDQQGIPVFHDDQRGTAVIIPVGIAGIRLSMRLGVHRGNLYAVDRQGVIHQGRKDLNPYKCGAADAERRTPADALSGPTS